jgi:hypothetical protein
VINKLSIVRLNTLLENDVSLILGQVCGKMGHEDTRRIDDDLHPGSKRRLCQEGESYRMIFNNENRERFHTRTNVRDVSLDNLHGDAGFTDSQTFL